ncbi:hypothetical protein H112_06389 [Trichophyton rubrum D6]|uniref:Uncharacterized protein n=3 Tax=Trichophyton TaxID=5550 RepID=A0A080WHB2_TRIRC|nr:uncharacterized protein TERG_11754 [Trichophyton rubrum CBS 118892]EZF13244.1 hypothetical protein H100_06404 [Trichophyton rubrum MR850]EZF39471.1 hypothetical protein H102_06370 [Trichophyton rubrum CBS 100081]EZF50298.1 hypothetical protein H103_06396 [Trichophyton rubrum CBS 288.86]EZF60929.1 hypothetical protein H104_06382 [Trichophyton rubrum CBS 289.86]EZF71446.1 hypothetical protein H105_06409 [Trichophyton soudanense CBS 452.61]EZF82256.1 hypothetical protein H110_06392 [Trichophy
MKDQKGLSSSRYGSKEESTVLPTPGFSVAGAPVCRYLLYLHVYLRCLTVCLGLLSPVACQASVTLWLAVCRLSQVPTSSLFAFVPGPGRGQLRAGLSDQRGLHEGKKREEEEEKKKARSYITSREACWGRCWDDAACPCLLFQRETIALKKIKKKKRRTHEESTRRKTEKQTKTTN